MGVPPLPRIVSPALLSYLRGHPQLPTHSWYYIAGVTLSVLNRPDEIPLLFQHALDPGGAKDDAKMEHAEQLMIARKMREGLIKSAAIGGLPKVRGFYHFPGDKLREPCQTNYLLN